MVAEGTIEIVLSANRPGSSDNRDNTEVDFLLSHFTGIQAEIGNWVFVPAIILGLLSWILLLEVRSRNYWHLRLTIQKNELWMLCSARTGFFGKHKDLG